jgi:ribosomal protein S18 acetylase RimI-like enzyme
MVKVRKANENDVDSIMNIVSKLVDMLNSEGNYQWNDTYPLKENFLLDLKNGDLYVACQNSSRGVQDNSEPTNEEDDSSDEILGFIAITTYQPPEYVLVHWNNDANIAIVPHRLGISPLVQGKGTAQLLMNHVEAVAHERHISCIRVDTNIVNHRMQHIFTKLDYSYIGNIFFQKGRYGKLEFKCYQKLLE